MAPIQLVPRDRSPKPPKPPKASKRKPCGVYIKAPYLGSVCLAVLRGNLSALISAEMVFHPEFKDEHVRLTLDEMLAAQQKAQREAQQSTPPANPTFPKET